MATYTNQWGETLNISDSEAQKYGYTPTVAQNSNVISADKMQGATPIVLPNTQTYDTSGTTVAGAGATADYISKLYADTEASKLNQSWLNDIASLTADSGNRGADQLQAEQSAGIGTMKQEYADLSGQIATKTAEYNALQSAEEKAVAGTEGQGRGITTGVIGGQQAAIRRQFLAEKNAKASEIGLIQAQAQAKQGQITQAQATVDRSIDLKYATIDSQIKTKQAQLDAIKPYLDKEEKIRAEKLQIYLDQQKQEYQDKKDAEKLKQSQTLTILSEAAKAGADSKTLANISSAKTSEEALLAAGSYIGKLERDKIALDKQQAMVDMAYKNAQIRALNQKIISESPAATTATKQTELLGNIQLVNDVLNSPNLAFATGLSGVFNIFPGSGAQLVKNQLKQIQGILALDNRQKLKGSGAISDFEAKTLAEAASAFGTNLSDTDAIKVLAKIKGSFQTAAGLQANVIVTNPQTGEKKQGIADRATIDQALANGYYVEYTK